MRLIHLSSMLGLAIYSFHAIRPAKSDMVLSVIAVTGLAGHAYGSWRSRISGKMWLQHMIPIDLPCARILTYGYDTKLAGSKSNARISEYAKQFLETIRDARHGDPHRPIISTGHSLGGLVIKEVSMILLWGSTREI